MTGSCHYTLLLTTMAGTDIEICSASEHPPPMGHAGGLPG